MSEFLAEARILVRPDTTLFRRELQAQVAAATRGITVPVAVTPIAARSTAVASASAAATQLATSSKAASVASLELAGSQAAVDAATRKSTASMLGASSAASKLDAGLLGLRTAVGSSAVIGLGAISLAAIAAGAAFRGMIIQTARFQQELSTFRATTGATADEMTRVSEAAKQLGADVRLPAVSSADAAIAMTELAKAGLSVEEAIAGAQGVLQLATAAQLSNADAAKIAANALNSFGLAGDQATRVADDFANAANAAQGSVADIGIALQQASAVARQVGLSLEDTTAILSLFAKNGLQGSDAGTSLRVALIRLVAPTKEAAAEIRRLGLNIRDASGNVRADVFAQFGEATRNLAPAVRDASAALIFGQDAIRAVSIGAREGAEGLRLMQFQIDQQGTAAEVASARTEGLAGSFSALQSNVQTLGVELGSLVAGPINVFLESINNAISTTTTLITNLTKLAKVDIPPIDIDVGIHITTGGRTGRVGDIANEVKGVVQSAVGQAVAQVVLSPATVSALRAKAIAQTFVGLAKGADDASKRVASLNKEIRSLQQARVQAEEGGATDIADRLTKRINALKDEVIGLKSAGEGIHDGVTKNLQESLATLEKLRETARAQDIPFIDSLIASLTKSIPITQQVEGNFNRLSVDTTELKNRFTDAAGGADALTTAMQRLAAQSSVLSDQLQKAQAEGASPQSQIAILQAQNKTQEQIIADSEKGGRQRGDITAIRKARAIIIANNAQIKSLQDGIVSDQKAAATASEKAATEAQKARDKQFQALADLFGGRQQSIEDQISRAGIAGNIQKQINLTKTLIASLVKERKALLDRLKKLNVSNEVRKTIMEAINRAIEQGKQDILRLNKEQKEGLQSLFDAALERADLRIRIAQARDDVAAEIAARTKRLQIITNALSKLKNAGKKNTTAWLELKAQQIEEIKAINELKGETEKKDKTQESFFNFLQSLQGFSANLLGNLIPGFATGGLVGGSSPQPAQGLRGAGQFGQPIQTESALSSARDRGVRPIQVDTTNQLLRQILRSLQNLNGRAAAPEARYQRSTGSAAADIF